MLCDTDICVGSTVKITIFGNFAATESVDCEIKEAAEASEADVRSAVMGCTFVVKNTGSECAGAEPDWCGPTFANDCS